MTINELAAYIIKSYLNEEFDENFSFVKSRKEKGMYRIGTYELEGIKYFYKIIPNDQFNDEDVIKENIKGYFKIPELLITQEFGDERINIYEFVDAVGTNCYNFLRRKSVSIEEKEKKLGTFFDKYIAFQKLNISKAKMDGTCKSDMWFHGRVMPLSRAGKFYGDNFSELLRKIKEDVPSMYECYASYLGGLYNYLDNQKELLTSYNHGDFHDFNFSLDNIFWDIDTFGINPIVNDFAIYYWHYYGREDNIVLRYSPWLIMNMHNELSSEELQEVRSLKRKEIIKYYHFIEEEYNKYGIKDNLFPEIKFKLFCRMFLIDNIFNYAEEDFLMVVKFFGNIINKKDNNVENILFSNDIK